MTPASPSDDVDLVEHGAQLRAEGRLDEAIATLRRALERAPEDGRGWSELAHALRWQGDIAAAYEAALQAVQSAPQFAPAWFNLGAVREARGEAQLGVDAYRRALELKPDFAEAWSNLGGVLGELGQRGEEIDAYRRAIDSNPRLAPVWSNLGNALRKAGELEEAVAACRRALDIHPGFAAAWTNLAAALRESGEFTQAVGASRSALELDPRLAEAWSNLGSGLQGLGRFAEAIEAYERAVALNPRNPALYLNLGSALEYSGRVTAAIAPYRRALEIEPGHPEAAFNLALALLTLGELREGWDAYECRWQRRDWEPRRHGFAPWRGELSRPCRLLAWSEQGVGDEIIYSGMLPDFAGSAVDVTLECEVRLAPLFARSFRHVKVVPRQSPPRVNPGDFDQQIPLASLGRWLRPALESFPRHRGYLCADPVRSAAYRRALTGADERMPLVGISWRSANPVFGGLKSQHLRDWTGVLATPGIRFVDLQYGDTRDERDALRNESGTTVAHLDDVDVFADLDGLAALVAACDLVITVSSVTAHMAGALGRPVWLMAPLARGKFWYWLAGRRDNPWYPSMRVFSQAAPGSWREVLGEVAGELTSRFS